MLKFDKNAIKCKSKEPGTAARDRIHKATYAKT